MQNINIVIADSDEKYIRVIEVKVLMELGESADIEIITEKSYLDEFFSVSRDINVLIVGECFYNQKFSRHSIDHIILLQNEMSTAMDTRQIKSMYKYSSANTILHSLKMLLENRFSNQAIFEKQTKVITVSSACGGVGKTTVAMGLAMGFCSRNYKVLFVSAERLHTFQEWFADLEEVPMDFYDTLIRTDTGTFSRIKNYIKHSYFDYIPAFKSVLCNLGLSMSIFSLLVREAKESGEYDVIVVDTDHVFDEDKGILLSASDIVVTVVTQNRRVVFATNCLIENMQMNSKDKFFFICNNFCESAKNDLNLSDCSFTILDYISHIGLEEEMSLKAMKDNKDFQKISYLLID